MLLRLEICQLWKRVSQSYNHRERPFWEQEPLVRDSDNTDMWKVCRLEISEVHRIEPELITPI